MNSDQQLENQIQAKGLTAPRVTPADVQAAIKAETYTVLPNGRTTVCQLTLDNGFTVEGYSAAVSVENFDAAIGNKVARENAVREVWPLLGFRLADKIAAAAGGDAVAATAPPAAGRLPVVAFQDGLVQTVASVAEFGSDTWLQVSLQLRYDFPYSMSYIERVRVLRNTHCNPDGSIAGSTAPPGQFMNGGTAELDARLARCNSSPFVFDVKLARGGEYVQDRDAPLAKLLGIPRVVALRAVDWAAVEEFCRWVGAENRRIGQK